MANTYIKTRKGQSIKALGGRKARAWRRLVASTANETKSDRLTRTMKFPLEQADNICFEPFKDLYEVTNGCGKGSLQGLLCAVHISGFSLSGSAGEARVLRDRKKLQTDLFSAGWEARFSVSPAADLPGFLINYLSKRHRTEYSEEKVVRELYKEATGRKLKADDNDAIPEFIKEFASRLHEKFNGWKELEGKACEAFRLFDDLAKEYNINIPSVKDVYDVYKDVIKKAPSTTTMAYDETLLTMPLKDLGDTAIHAVVAQKWHSSGEGAKANDLKKAITTDSNNALNWLFGKGFLCWRKEGVDTIMEELRIPAKNKDQITALKEWFCEVPDETLFGYGKYDRFRSELGGKIDSWVTNYHKRLTDLRKLVDKIEPDYQLDEKLKQPCCEHLFHGLDMSAEGLEQAIKNVADGRNKINGALDKLMGKADTLPTKDDVDAIYKFSARIDSLSSFFPELNNRIKQEEGRIEGAPPNAELPKEVTAPGWLQALPKVNSISGGIPDAKKELDDILTRYNEYRRAYDAHICKALKWGKENGKLCDPIAALGERELELLTKKGKPKDQEKANMQARRKILHSVARLGVNSTNGAKKLIKSRLEAACGISKKDLNKLISNGQGALYRSPFSKGRHEAFYVDTAAVENMDMIGFLKTLTDDLKGLADSNQDLRHQRDWLRMEGLYNRTRLYTLPEKELPVSLVDECDIASLLQDRQPRMALLLKQKTIERSLLIRVFNLYQSEISGLLAQLFRESFIIKTKFQRVDVNELVYVPKNREWRLPKHYLRSKKPLGDAIRSLELKFENEQYAVVDPAAELDKLVKTDIKKQRWPRARDKIGALMVQSPHDWYFDMALKPVKDPQDAAQDKAEPGSVCGYRVGKKGVYSKKHTLKTPFRLIGPSAFKGWLDKRLLSGDIKIGEHNLIVGQEFSQKVSQKDGGLVVEIEPKRTFAELAVTLTEKAPKTDESSAPVQETLVGIDLGEAGIGYAVFGVKEIIDGKCDVGKVKPRASGAIAIATVRSLIRRVNHYRNRTQPNQRFQQRYDNSLQMLRENAIGDVCHIIDSLCRKYKGLPVLESSVRNLATGSKQLKLVYDHILNLYTNSDVDAHKTKRWHHWCGGDLWKHPDLLQEEEKKSKGDYVKTGKVVPLKHFPGVTVNPAGTSQTCSACDRNPHEIIDDYKDVVAVDDKGEVKIGEDEHTISLKSQFPDNDSKDKRRRDAKYYRRMKENPPYQHPYKACEISADDFKKQLKRQLRQPPRSTRSQDTKQSVYQCVFADCEKSMHADENAAINIVRKWAKDKMAN